MIEAFSIYKRTKYASEELDENYCALGFTMCPKDEMNC
jgi:hypothetical protein